MARPLTKTTKKGALYARPVSVETKIDTVIGKNDWADLKRRAGITDDKSPEFLPSECFVHLIRDAIRRDDQRIATLLMTPLLVRCEANLLKTVPDSAMRNAEQVREEILGNFQDLFTKDAAEDALDYYECRFGRAFRALRINHLRSEFTRRKELMDLPEISNDDGDTMTEDEVLAGLSRIARVGPSQENQVYLAHVLKAVSDLPPNQRRAVILRRIIGHEEKVVAKMCGVDVRTIRNWLAAAVNGGLKKLKEDL